MSVWRPRRHVGVEAMEVQRSASRKEGNNQTMEAARLPVEE
jgi:hypothetical protein